MTETLPFGFFGALYILAFLWVFRIPYWLIRKAPLNQFEIFEGFFLKKAKTTSFWIGLVYAIGFSTFAAYKGEYIFIGILLLFSIVTILLFLAARIINKP